MAERTFGDILSRALRDYRDQYGGGASFNGLTAGIGRYEAIRGLSGTRPDLDQRTRILQTQPRPSATEGRSVGSKSHRTAKSE